MASGTSGSLSITQSYRHLYRNILHAVQFSKPARYVARDQLRDAYRKGDPESFDSAKIQRTLEFLEAAKHTGPAHKLLKNLLTTEYYRRQQARMVFTPMTREETHADHIKATSHAHYRMTLAMLNDSMGLCLR